MPRAGRASGQGMLTRRSLVGIGIVLGAIALAAQPPALASAQVVTASAGMVEYITGPFPRPFSSAIAVGPEDTVWLVGETPIEGFVFPVTTLDRITATGVVTGEFVIPLLSKQAYYENEIWEISPGEDGSAWFTSYSPTSGQAFIGRVTAAGKVTEFDVTNEFGEYPGGVAQGLDGDAWYTESDPNRIGVIEPDGIVRSFMLPAFDGAGKITLGADGNMWFAATHESKPAIGRITPTGVITDFPIASSAEGIAAGSGGAVWFTEPGVSKVGRITPSGEVAEFSVPSAGDGIALGADGNMWFGEALLPDGIDRITASGAVTRFFPIPDLLYSPERLATGTNGDVWLNGVQLGRLIVPFAPESLEPPVIGGSAVEDQTLSVSTGAWRNAPNAFGYQWELCDASGANCTELYGEVGARVALALADVGHTLRAVVTASNAGGATAQVSGASAAVSAPAAPTTQARQEPQQPQPQAPVVDTTMTWILRSVGIVESLTVHHLPSGDIVEVGCQGHGCAFSHWRAPAVSRKRVCHARKCAIKFVPVTKSSRGLAQLFKGRRLAVGARIVVTVTRVGWIGKRFVLTVSASGPPHEHGECLAPGSTTDTVTCPAGTTF
jgi:streptogramin lyase